MAKLFHKLIDSNIANIVLKSENSDEILNILASWAIMVQVFLKFFYGFIFSMD